VTIGAQSTCLLYKNLKRAVGLLNAIENKGYTADLQLVVDDGKGSLPVPVVGGGFCRTLLRSHLIHV